MRSGRASALPRYKEIKLATFTSKYKHYKLVMIPSRKDIISGMPVVVYGRSLVFNDGKYITDKQDEIDYIRKHSDFNRVVFETEIKTMEEELAPVIIAEKPAVISELLKPDPELKVEIKKTVKRKVKRTAKAKTKVG